MKRKLKREYLRDDDFLLEIGKIIKKLRNERNWTQTELATLCDDIDKNVMDRKQNKDYTQISRMESGKVNFSISYLAVLAKAFGVSPKDLIP